jgi:hypothetical protein
MASVSIKTSVLRKLADAFAKGLNRFTKAARISQPATQPDNRFGIIWIGFVTLLRFVEPCLHFSFRFR